MFCQAGGEIRPDFPPGYPLRTYVKTGNMEKETIWRAKLDQARELLPLKWLMEQRGKAPANGRWKSFPHCPYCRHKGSAGVFAGPHGDLFKCHYAGCASGTQYPNSAWDEIGFLAFELGMNRRDAIRAWLKQAGLWQEEHQ